MQRFWVMLIICIWGVGLSAQTPLATHLKDEISFYMDVTVHAAQGEHRIRANDALVASLDSFINLPGSFDLSLDSIPGLTILKGDGFRIISWQLKVSEEEYKYHCLMQWPDRVVRFKDSRPFVNGAEYTVYTPSSWYGCLYYSILPFEHEKQVYYLLLGFNAETSQLNTKIADILDLTGPEPRLGVPLFTSPESSKSRIIFTYADVSSAHLSYDKDLKGIVFDHLINMPGVGPEGEALPVSDGSLEAYILKKGTWNYETEVYDVEVKEPPMTDERKNRKEDKDILGRPKHE